MRRCGVTLQKRVERLEQQVGLPGEIERPTIMIFYEGETEAQTLERYGLPVDYKPAVWLPKPTRVTIGGIDLEHDI